MYVRIYQLKLQISAHTRTTQHTSRFNHGSARESFMRSKTLIMRKKCEIDFGQIPTGMDE